MANGKWKMPIEMAQFKWQMALANDKWQTGNT